MYFDTNFASSFVAFGRDMALGGSAAAIAKTTVAPIERIKLLLQLQATSTQIQPGGHYKGIIDCAKRIPKEQGFASFWRGNLTNVYRSSMTQALNFAFKDTYKNLFTVHTEKFWRKVATNVASGGAAGVTSICIMYPLDFARTRLSTDVGAGETRHFRGMWHCMRTIVASDGIRGLYGGISLSLPNVLVYRSIYFGMFDTAKMMLPDSPHTSIVITWALAQSCTTTAGFIGYPLDTVRRRLVMQSGRENRHYNSAIDCFRTMYREEGGIRAFYKGALTNVFRGMGGALVLVFYDEMKKFV